MNFGAICANAGQNITSDGLTIWRNAVYMLAGLEVPATKATLPQTAINNPYNNESSIISEKYFTLNGSPIKEPGKGVFIKKTIFENGTVRVDKVILTNFITK